MVSVTEVTGMEEGTITSQEIFRFKREGIDDDGRVIGSLVPTGVIPCFVDELQEARIKVPMEIFGEDETEDE